MDPINTRRESKKIRPKAPPRRFSTRGFLGMNDVETCGSMLCPIIRSKIATYLPINIYPVPPPWCGASTQLLQTPQPQTYRDRKLRPRLFEYTLKKCRCLSFAKGVGHAHFSLDPRLRKLLQALESRSPASHHQRA